MAFSRPLTHQSIDMYNNDAIIGVIICAS